MKAAKPKRGPGRPKLADATAYVGVDMPADLKDWLAARAEQQDRPLAGYIRRLLEQHRNSVEAGRASAKGGEP